MLTLPIPVSRALRKLGHDIKDARRRRRITMAIAAERASISKPTFIRVERGDPSVSIGSYATVLYVLGMADRLGDLAASQRHWPPAQHRARAQRPPIQYPKEIPTLRFAPMASIPQIFGLTTC